MQLSRCRSNKRCWGTPTTPTGFRHFWGECRSLENKRWCGSQRCWGVKFRQLRHFLATSIEKRIRHVWCVYIYLLIKSARKVSELSDLCTDAPREAHEQKLCRLRHWRLSVGVQSELSEFFPRLCGVSPSFGIHTCSFLCVCMGLPA